MINNKCDNYCLPGIIILDQPVVNVHNDNTITVSRGAPLRASILNIFQTINVLFLILINIRNNRKLCFINNHICLKYYKLPFFHIKWYWKPYKFYVVSVQSGALDIKLNLIENAQMSKKDCHKCICLMFYNNTC